jgi:hypothetical protein
MVDDPEDGLIPSGLQYSADILQSTAEFAWPDFIEVRGCVLLATGFSEANFESWWSRYADHPHAIEAVLNEVHFYDLVDDSYEESQLPKLERAAIRVRDAWSAALAAKFPDRRFTVEYATEPDQYGPTISFHQAKNCPGCTGK